MKFIHTLFRSDASVVILKILISVFLIEIVLMFLLIRFGVNISIKEAFLDSLLLTLIFVPVLYFWIIQPFAHKAEQARTELANSQKRLLQAQEVALLGSWELDLVSNQLFWSDQVYEIFEIEKQKFKPTYEGFIETVHPNDRDLVSKAYTESVLNRGTYDIDHRLLMRDGRVKYVNERGTSYYDDNGNAIRSIGTVLDITAKKTLELELEENKKELQRVNLKLESEVAKRTLALEAEKTKAVEANQVKSRFFANISHELRTPIHAILSFSGLGIKHIEGARVKRYLENIQKSGKRLSGLVDDLLDLSKLESGKLAASFELNDLTEIVLSAIDELGGLINEKFLTVNVNTVEPVEGFFDKSLITQVIVNLLSNAIKFSDRYSLIDLSIEKKLKQDKAVIFFSILDRGMGIPSEEIETIFESFFQSSNTRPESGGTGLGLSISKEIIELHQGRIWAESPPANQAKGTQFMFELPVDENNSELIKV